MKASAPAEAPGNLFVVAAPSGAGKSTLVKALLELDSRLTVSVSHTTRAPRGQERNGREYWFVDEAHFGRLFDQAVLIFVLPPSWEELRQRLERRGEDTPEAIEQRLANARVEVAQARHFDFVIINALFETALFDLKTVVHSQRLRYSAQQRNRSQVFAALGL